MPVKVQMLLGDSSVTFQADGNTSVLDLALAQGIKVDYSCKRGDCGQCAAKLVSGKIAPLEAARTWMRDGEVHLCNVVAQSDLDVRLPFLPEIANQRVLRSPCKIQELHPLSDDVMKVVLRLPPAIQFDFLPGQYIRITNKERITRSYSLAEGPKADKLLTFHVRKVESGLFSQYLFSNARLGDLLHLEGPIGRFFLRNSERGADETLFLATGTGIAPIYAILSSLTPEQILRCGKLSIYWGNRVRLDEYLRDSLAVCAERINAQLNMVVSRELVDGAQGSHPRHIQDLLAMKHHSLKGAQVFACGNLAMIESTREFCLAAGLIAENFHCDPFTAS